MESIKSAAGNSTNGEMGSADDQMPSGGIILMALVFLLLFCVGVLALLVGLCGNFVTLLTILCTRLCQSCINKYIVVLLSSDTLFILWLMSLPTPLKRVNFWTCTLLEYVATGSVCASSNILVLITMERFFAVFYPLRHIQYSHVSRWRVIFFGLLPMQIWAFAYQLFPYSNSEKALKYLNLLGNASNYSAEVSICYAKNNFALDYMNIPFYVAAFFLPLVTIFLVNIGIVVKLHSRRSRQEEEHVPRSAAEENNKVLIVLPTLYAVLTLPLFLFAPMSSYGIFDHAIANHELILLLLTICAVMPYYFFNFVYNWLVYAMASPSFRKEFRLFWCKKKSNKKPSQSEGTKLSTLNPPTTIIANES